MASKKSSQAQPIRHPAEGARQGVENDDQGGEDRPGQLPATRGRSSGDASLAGASNARYECPPWPPGLNSPTHAAITAELAALVAGGDWGHYQAQVLKRLTESIAAFLNVRHVRTVCSGSAAIELALRASGIDGQRNTSSERGGTPEVICPVLDYPGNARAVRLLGGLPVMVDSAAGRWTIDADAVLAAATPQTVAVIATHLYGEIAPVNRLRELCDAHRWTLIEDVCQMPGGRLAGRPLGTFGHVAAWSFGGSKPLTAGCGGAITTDDDRIAQRLASHADRPSDAFPLSPLQAAVLIPQWNSLATQVSDQNARLGRLVDRVQETTPQWCWPTRDDPVHSMPIYYKVPIRVRAETVARRPGGVQHLVRAANEKGLPAGEPFRIPGRLAASRGRVVSAENATEIASQSWLVDHRVLAGDDASIDSLAEVLYRLYRDAYDTHDSD
jgi:dTDP-4-amino-4,6-dideoxygalactose transaminase